jgi:hypothetical protein
MSVRSGETAGREEGFRLDLSDNRSVSLLTLSVKEKFRLATV